jgi:hypothetical protein
MRRTARALVALCLLLALAAPVLEATTAIEMGTEDMTREAEVIVSGRCTDLRSTWIDRDLVTLATISVSEVLKGTAGPEITVVLPGGADSNRKFPVAMVYPAAPELAVQENALLFLSAEGRVVDGYSIVGFSQGKFTIAADPSGKLVASQNLSDLKLQGRHGAARRGGSQAVPYAQIRQQVLDILARR